MSDTVIVSVRNSCSILEDANISTVFYSFLTLSLLEDE